MPVLITVIAVLIFPFFPLMCLSWDKDKKTVIFYIKIFGIKIYSVILTVTNNGVLIKKLLKKPYYFKFSLPKNGIKLPSGIKKIGILSINSKLSLGIKENVISVCSTVFALKMAETLLFNFIKTEKPFLKINNEINIFENTDIFNAELRLKTVLNLIDVLTILFNILTEKIYYAISK